MRPSWTCQESGGYLGTLKLTSSKGQLQKLTNDGQRSKRKQLQLLKEIISVNEDLTFSSSGGECRNFTLKECEDVIHTLEMGIQESFGTPKTSEFDCKGQKTSHWGVIYIIGKLSNCGCRKWACMNHLDICNTSYNKKKSWESN